MIDNAFTIKPLSGLKPKQLVLFLHGVGSNGENLISIAYEIQDILPEAIFISPDAPFPYDGPGNRAYQWFSLQDRQEHVLLHEMERAVPFLKDFIDQELQKLDLQMSDLIIIGFSQGTMIGLYSALRHLEGSCKAMIGFSGILLGGSSLRENLKNKPKIFLIHGDKDDVVPPSSLRAASVALKACDVPVSTYSCENLGHTIDEEGIWQLRGFLETLQLD